MPNELSIQAVQGLSGLTDAGADPKPVPAPPAPADQPARPAQPFVNPSLRLDAALGLIVIEFRDDAGALTSTIPSQRQIEAYRMHQQALPQQALPQPATPETAPATTPNRPVLPDTAAAAEPAPATPAPPPQPRKT